MGDEYAERCKSTEEKYVIFRLGETLFGVDVERMLRIVRLSPITRVPRAPQFLEGVFNYRGQVVPVVDLHKRLALPGVEYGDQVRILIVELEAQPVGMLADAVIGISRLPGETIQPATGTAVPVDVGCLAGVARQGERPIFLLDLGRVLVRT